MKTRLVEAFRFSLTLSAALALSLAFVVTTGCGGPTEPDDSVLDRVPKVKASSGRDAPAMDVKNKDKK